MFIPLERVVRISKTIYWHVNHSDYNFAVRNRRVKRRLNTLLRRLPWQPNAHGVGWTVYGYCKGKDGFNEDRGSQKRGSDLYGVFPSPTHHVTERPTLKIVFPVH